MLYDNSQLARVYLHAWQVTGDEFFRTITEEILDYVVREMLDPAAVQMLRAQHLPSSSSGAGTAGFYSTQDADSEGEEGKFFVWTPGEIREVLGSEADAFMAAYAVTRHGNASTGSAHGFEGKNILEFVGDIDQRPTLAEARRKLFEAREKRVHPGRDEKVLTSWNGLMLAAFAEAARVLDRDDYREVAERNAEFLLRELRQENSRLLRTWKRRPEHAEGAGEAKLNGYLEDYSYLIEGLLELYQTTFEPPWFVAAQELAETMIAHFQAPDSGFFDTSDDHETLITRPRDLQDNATPSGNAMAVTAIQKLAGFTNDLPYVDIAHQALSQMQPMLAQYPLAQVLCNQKPNCFFRQKSELLQLNSVPLHSWHPCLEDCRERQRDQRTHSPCNARCLGRVCPKHRLDPRDRERVLAPKDGHPSAADQDPGMLRRHSGRTGVSQGSEPVSAPD
jgi:uncharacterized protein YyaL (SSP411 family)